MSLLTAEFMGGPLDGQIREMQPVYRPDPLCWQDGEPPILVNVAAVKPYDFEGEKLYAVETMQYARRINPRDDGALWEYLYVPPEGSAS